MCYAPENTLAAFEIAIRQGTYRIELDVRSSRDGCLVLMHDATVDRMTDGHGRLADLTLDELKRLTVGGSERIPTFEETLAAMKGRCKLLVEIKDHGIADEVVRLIRQAGMTADCTISSFDEGELVRVKQLDPSIATAYFLTEPKPFDPQDVIGRLGASLLVVWPRAAVPEQIAAAKAAGMQVRCGFGDTMGYEQTAEQFRRMADMGVDEMACGRPDWIARMAAEYAAGASPRPAWYEQLGDALGRRYLEYPFARGTEQEISFLKERALVRPGLRVLDVGCGAGRHARALAALGCEVTGIDISTGLLHAAEELAREDGVRVRFMRLDARALPFQDEFDLALCVCEGAFGLTDSEEEDLAILHGIRRALVPGGRLVLTAINALSVARNRGIHPGSELLDVAAMTTRERIRTTDAQGRPVEVEGWTRAYTPRELKLLCRIAGLALDAVHGVTAGHWEAKPLDLDDIEVMILAHRT
jgi:glycerophosphoryl diester phosphodiesterase/SAM-dependent methyltransferase